MTSCAAQSEAFSLPNIAWSSLNSGVIYAAIDALLAPQNRSYGHFTGVALCATVAEGIFATGMRGAQKVKSPFSNRVTVVIKPTIKALLEYGIFSAACSAGLIAIAPPLALVAYTAVITAMNELFFRCVTQPYFELYDIETGRELDGKMFKLMQSSETEKPQSQQSEEWGFFFASISKIILTNAIYSMAMRTFRSSLQVGLGKIGVLTGIGLISLYSARDAFNDAKRERELSA